MQLVKNKKGIGKQENRGEEFIQTAAERDEPMKIR